MAPRGTIKATVSVPVSAMEVARLFAEMTSSEQATFFNEVARIVKQDWRPHCTFSMQMRYLTDEVMLTDEGRAIMQTIGTYSERD